MPPLNGNHPLEGELFRRRSLRRSCICRGPGQPRGRWFWSWTIWWWTDPASVELLIHLFQLAEQAGILFLCTTQIERERRAASDRRRARSSHGGNTRIWLITVAGHQQW